MTSVDPARLLAAVVRRIADDPDLGPWTTSDQGGHLVDLLAWAVGAGPAPAPAPGLGHARFSLLASHVADALDGLAVPPVAAADVLDRLNGSRAEVVIGPADPDFA